jgi:hypothetical protein
MTLDKGISLDGGVGHYTEPVHYADEVQKFGVKLGLDFSFHIAVKVILLNILFGIIVDTFASMREEKKMMEQDKLNNCFICNESRIKFELQQLGGFITHIDRDHHLWFYVYYIVHLTSKKYSDYTGVESYVFSNYDKGEITWIPRGRALCLDKNDKDEGESY